MSILLCFLTIFSIISLKLSESDMNIIKKMIRKFSTKEITDIVSQITDVPKKEIYKYCLKLKNEK